MPYAVKLTTALGVELIEGRQDSDMLDFCYKNIDCSMIEIPHVKNLEPPYVMICDEEGLLKGEPVLNFMASYLYDTHKHHHPIVGDVVILKEIDSDEGPALSLLDKGEALTIARQMQENGRVAYDKVKKALTKAGVLKKA